MVRSNKRRIGPATRASIAQPLPPVVGEPLTPILFKGSGTYIIAGPESHHVYCFSSHDPEQMVDARDTEAFLKTGLFLIGS